MIKIVPLTILILSVLNLASGQSETKTDTAGQSAATVRTLKGTCLIRDNEAGKPRKLTTNDQLKVGQQLQCEAKAKLTIQFRASGVEKEIQTISPKWYQIPSVPSEAFKSDKARAAGRIKGDKTPPANSLATPVNVGEPKPLQDSAVGANFDAADMYWKARKKYFLLVAASKSTGTETNLPFTKVDAKGVEKALTRLGYEPLGLGTLEGETATRENFVTELQKIRTLPANAVVVVYYSGHAAADPSGRDLWLQLYGQKKFGDHYGLSIDDLIGSARGNVYKGELSVILDTCFSGRAANSTQLKEGDNTVVFTSSSYQQPSVSFDVPTGIEMSAFTYYLIQGLTNQWAQVDGDADGIIMYSDLGVYIANRLSERFRDRTLLGPMQPQLFGGFSRNWVGYDATQARNFNTEPRKTVALERAVQLQDPETTIRMLGDISSASADSYLRALQAVHDKKFDAAMTLLEDAEKEARVSPAQIYWARGHVKMEHGELAGAREWLDKAVAASVSNPNPDLLGYDALMHFALGNWPRSEELFKQVLQLSPSEATTEEDDEHLTAAATMFVLSMINLFQGDFLEADLYLKRLKEIDPEELEAEEEGASFAVPFLEVLSDLLQNKVDSAKRKLEALQHSDSWNSATGQWKQIFDRFAGTLASAMSANDTGEVDAAATAEHFRQWEAALQQREVTTLLLLLTQTQMLSASSKLLDSKQGEDLLARTVKFAQEHRVEKPVPQVKSIAGVQVTEVKGSEEQFAFESAMLLVGAGQLYAEKNDLANAEKALKEGIAIQLQQQGGVAMSFGAVFQLADVYQRSRRFTEAEAQFKGLLKNLREPLGEESFYAYLVESALGKLYEDWNRPQDAETAYREALRLALSLGPDNVFAIEGRQTLGDFLAGNNNHAEAAQYYEAAIRSLEQNPNRNSLLGSDSFGDLYFSLSKSYYGMGNFDAAEKSLSRSATVLSSSGEPELNKVLECLEWQWATAIVLKKQNEADAFYKKLLDILQSELAKPTLDESLGAELLNLASWYKDWDVDKSEQLFRLALDVQTKRYGNETPDVADVWVWWAELKEVRSQYGVAITYLNNARQIYQKQAKPDAAKVSYTLYKIGLDTYERQDFEQARVLLKESSELLATIPTNSRADSFSRYEWPTYMLARVERILKNYDAAKSLISSILDLDQSDTSADHDAMIADLLELAAISRLQQKDEEAAAFLTRAQTFLDRLPTDKAFSRRAKLVHERGMLALFKGQAKQAEPLLREAIEKGEKDPQMDQFQLAEFLDDYAHLLRQRHKDKDAVPLEEKARRIRDILRNGN